MCARGAPPILPASRILINACSHVAVPWFIVKGSWTLGKLIVASYHGHSESLADKFPAFSEEAQFERRLAADTSALANGALANPAGRSVQASPMDSPIDASGRTDSAEVFACDRCTAGHPSLQWGHAHGCGPRWVHKVLSQVAWRKQRFGWTWLLSSCPCRYFLLLPAPIKRGRLS